MKFACVCVVVGVALGGCWCGWVPYRPPLQADSVRAAIVVAMDEFKVKDANGVVKMIGKRKKDFRGSDRCWLIEKGLLENLSGDSAAARVQELLLSKFPAKDRAVAETVCIAEVQKLISVDGFKMLPFTEQATIKFAAQLGQAVENETTKQLKVANVSESSVMLWQACVFCRHRGNTSTDAGIKDYAAGEAIHSLVHAVEHPLPIAGAGSAAQKKKDQEDNVVVQVAKLRKYEFCALPADKHDVARIVARAPAPKAKACAAKAKAKAGSKAAKADEAASSAAAKFFC